MSHDGVGILRDLLGRTLVDDVGRIKPECAACRDVGAHAAFRSLLGNETLRKQTQPRAAMLFRCLHAPQADFASLSLKALCHILRQDIGIMLNLVLLRYDALANETARSFLEHHQLLGHLPGAFRANSMSAIAHLPVSLQFGLHDETVCCGCQLIIGPKRDKIVRPKLDCLIPAA